MRIIAGYLKGRSLEPIGNIQGIRPTLSFHRENIFNILHHLFPLEGKSFLDLYAGSGSVGLEAMSRGASFCTFVEMNPAIVTILNKNIQKCSLQSRTHVINEKVENIKTLNHQHDVVFIDPPFPLITTPDFFQKTINHPFYTNTQLYIIQYPHTLTIELPAHLHVAAYRKYGRSIFFFLTQNKI